MVVHPRPLPAKMRHFFRNLALKEMPGSTITGEMRTERDDETVLDELMKQGARTARKLMEWNGGFDRTILIDGIEGKVAYSPPLDLVNECFDHFPSVAREMAAAYGATAVVIAAEATLHDERGQLGNVGSKKEILSISGQTRDKCRHVVVPVIRSEDGNLKGFGEAIELPGENVSKYYANLIETELLDEETRKVAKELLREQGHRIKYDRLQMLSLFR
jgi:hypothetical protein